MGTVEYRIYPRALKQRGDRGRGERKGEVSEGFVGREEGRKEGEKRERVDGREGEGQRRDDWAVKT